MGFLEVLTLLFIGLKLAGVISWSWWLVLLPEIIALAIYVIWFGLVVTLMGWMSGFQVKSIRKKKK